MRKTLILAALTATLAGCGDQTNQKAGPLVLNDLEYFERQGVNVLVYSNNFNG